MLIFIKLPIGFDLGSDSRKYVIKLNISFYGLNQASHNWFELLKCSLDARGYDH